MSPHQALQGAAARAKARVGLYKQGIIFLLVALALAGINWATFRGRWWFWWPALGLALLWGLKAVVVYNHRRFETMEQRLRQEEQDREERTRQIVDD